MINDNEIKLAVEYAEISAVQERIQPLIDLAKSYLSCSGVMPEKKKLKQESGNEEGFFRRGKNEGFNECHDLCTLALTKRLSGLDKLIEDCKHSCPACEGSGQVYADFKAHFPSDNARTVRCGNCGGVGTTIDIDNLVTAIRKEIMEDSNCYHNPNKTA